MPPESPELPPLLPVSPEPGGPPSELPGQMPLEFPGAVGPPAEPPGLAQRAAVMTASPFVGAMQMARPAAGIGQLDFGGRQWGFMALAFLAVAGVLSYQAGKAMAPSPADERTWAVVGVPVGLLTGVIGLGVMGWVSTTRK